MLVKICAFDQSTKCSGVCVLKNGKIIETITIDKSKNRDIVSRTKEMFLDLVDVIKKVKPDVLVVEAVQQQNSPKTTMVLSQLQGMLIGYAYEHSIEVLSPMPTEWRKVLEFHQGPSIKRQELKAQSIEYVKNNFGQELNEDAAEAVCIACASYALIKKSKKDAI